MRSTTPNWLRWGGGALIAVVLIALPFQFEAFRVNQFITWMCIAVAAAGLNLLTGYNGQISVGHGALYGLGAYAAAMASGYNGRLPVPEVLVRGGDFAVVRPRPSFDEVLDQDRIPDWLAEPPGQGRRGSA